MYLFLWIQRTQEKLKIWCVWILEGTNSIQGTKSIQELYILYHNLRQRKENQILTLKLIQYALKSCKECLKTTPAHKLAELKISVSEEII